MLFVCAPARTHARPDERPGVREESPAASLNFPGQRKVSDVSHASVLVSFRASIVLLLIYGVAGTAVAVRVSKDGEGVTTVLQAT